MRRIDPGIAIAVGAYFIWGLLPSFIKLLAPLPAPDILAHRILWSLLLMTAIALALRRGAGLAAIVRRPGLLAALAASALLIGGNWLVYIRAVNAGHVLDASLGYFINPLVNVVLGVVVLRERLGRTEWAAVALAAAGVLLLTVVQHRLPLVPLWLATSFALYGLIRKMIAVDPVDGLLIETALLAAPAIAWLLLAGTPGAASDPGWLLLAATGVVTAAPLMLFAAAAVRVRLSDLGLLQYISPTLQLLLAVAVYHEPLGGAQLPAFAMIWAALALYVVGATRRERAATVALD